MVRKYRKLKVTAVWSLVKGIWPYRKFLKWEFYYQKEQFHESFFIFCDFKQRKVVSQIDIISIHLNLCSVQNSKFRYLAVLLLASENPMLRKILWFKQYFSILYLSLKQAFELFENIWLLLSYVLSNFIITKWALLELRSWTLSQRGQETPDE